MEHQGPSTPPPPGVLQTAFKDEATVSFKLQCEFRRHVMEGSSSDLRSYPGQLFWHCIYLRRSQTGLALKVKCRRIFPEDIEVNSWPAVYCPVMTDPKR